MARHRLLQLLTVGAILTHGPVNAQTRASVQVVARVLTRVAVDVRHAPAVIHVSPQDVERGYVQLPEPMLMTVQTNLPAGVWIEITPLLAFAVRTEVERENGAGTAGSMVRMPHGTSTARLSVRVYLAPRTIPGDYEFPVHVAMAT